MNDPIKTYTLYNAIRVLPESRIILQISQVPVTEKYEEDGKKMLAILNVFEIATIQYDDNKQSGRIRLSRDSISTLAEMLVEALKESKE